MLLRISVAASMLFLNAAPAQTFYVPNFVGVLVAIGLCAGLQTRILAALSLVASLLSFIPAGASIELGAVNAISCVALAIAGPGAFSLDARLFGRRTITLPDDYFV
jgi:uncharacterized membrane protein YphA (DoxX/SURF4 family)